MTNDDPKPNDNKQSFVILSSLELLASTFTRHQESATHGYLEFSFKIIKKAVFLCIMGKS
jgi:hypothetical protein